MVISYSMHRFPGQGIYPSHSKSERKRVFPDDQHRKTRLPGLNSFQKFQSYNILPSSEKIGSLKAKRKNVFKSLKIKEWLLLNDTFLLKIMRVIGSNHSRGKQLVLVLSNIKSP